MIYKFREKHIVFSNDVLNKLNSYKQIKQDQHEAGGVILGKVYNDLILIDRISKPTREDKSGRFYFCRNVQKAQSIIENAWVESKGERIYLGEWHTHPEDTPTPSTDDKKLLRNMLKDSYMEIDFLFMVIIGISNTFVGVQKSNQVLLEELVQLKSSDGLEITLYENNQNKLIGFKVVGYLNLAPIGKDIYNAAFSQIFFGTINSIFAMTKLSEYILDQEKAFIRFIIPNLDYRKETIVTTLLNSLELQIGMIIEEMEEKQLKKHVILKRECLS